MFNPLSMLGVIRNDHDLAPIQKLILCMAVGRTDNGTGRVRCSQEQLAKDAGVTVRTVQRFYRSTSFTRYLERDEIGRRVNLAWRFNPSARIRLIPDTVSPDTVSPDTLTPDTVSPLLVVPTTRSLMRDLSVKPVEPIRGEYSNVDEYIEAYDTYELHLMQHMEHKLMQLNGALEHYEAPVAPWEPDEPDEPRYVHWRDVDVSDVPKPRKIL